MKENRLEEYRALELMCISMIKVIELHRLGVETHDDVLNRASWLNFHIEKLLSAEEKKEKEK